MNHSKKLLCLASLLLGFVFFSWGFGCVAVAAEKPPIYITFQWHMHQPIYFPYESVVETERNQRFPFSLFNIHTARVGPYTAWPMDAVEALTDAGFQNAGVQISFSGSLAENLTAMSNGGYGFSDWLSGWHQAQSLRTALNNPRLQLVGFAYHHALMPLLDFKDMDLQIKLHELLLKDIFNVPKHPEGFFPPENAFHENMIPALVTNGYRWVIVDNIHLERATAGYPYRKEGFIIEPNAADARNPNPKDWMQMQRIWAPTPVSAAWAHRPHWVEWVNPNSAKGSYRMIAVPASHYMGNADFGGGYGDLNYELVMSQLEAVNTDPRHPLLIVLHHDGDNGGTNSYDYYHRKFNEMIDWLKQNPTRFQVTAIQDYIDRFPPADGDVAHVEPGSWRGADGGDPEFSKWTSKPRNMNDITSDQRSWAVVTAAKNRVLTAETLEPGDVVDMFHHRGNDSSQAWRYLLNSQTSCYWYWDGDKIWDNNPVRASNQAVASADRVIAAHGEDPIGPTIFYPQRIPYNPGATEFGKPQPSDFWLYTYAYDISGVTDVSLFYRVDRDGRSPARSTANERYRGSDEVGPWDRVPMAEFRFDPRGDVMPKYVASRYAVQITDLRNVLIDYYIEATDGRGNRSRTPIYHMAVGRP